MLTCFKKKKKVANKWLNQNTEALMHIVLYVDVGYVHVP